MRSTRLLGLGILCALACAAREPGDFDDSSEVVDLGDALPDGEAGKADSRDLAFDLLPIPAGTPESTAPRRRLIASASDWRALFRTDPAGIDFAHEWAIYYGAGTQPTQGFSAEVRGVRIADDFRSLVATTALVAPGRFCVPEARSSTPQTLVRIARPTTPIGAIRWIRGAESRDCAPPAAADCAVLHCVRGSYCSAHSGSAQCIPYATCALVPPSCPSGTRCQDLLAGCFRLPCPPTTPSCQPYGCPPAGTLRCGGRVLVGDLEACHGEYHDWIVASCPGVRFTYDS